MKKEQTFEQKYPHVTKALLLAALRENAVHPADAASPTILRAIAEGVEAGGISPDTAARHLRAAADELEMQNRLMPEQFANSPTPQTDEWEQSLDADRTEWRDDEVAPLIELCRKLEGQLALRSETQEPQGTKLSARWFESEALCFASELFVLINYRRSHSLSREIWHEADESDISGRRCIQFLNDRGLLESHPEHPTWWRFKDEAKRAKPFIPGAICG
jgi:hypothetical protein